MARTPMNKLKTKPLDELEGAERQLVEFEIRQEVEKLQRAFKDAPEFLAGIGNELITQNKTEPKRSREELDVVSDQVVPARA